MNLFTLDSLRVLNSICPHSFLRQIFPQVLISLLMCLKYVSIFFFKQGTVQDGLQNAINLIIFPSQKLEFDPFFKTKKIFVNGKHLGRVSSVRLTNLFGDFTNRR